MLNRKYSVIGQEVTLKSIDKIASDQIAFVRCQFDFSNEWLDINAKTAQFRQGEKTVEQLLDNNNECDLPQELEAGRIFISVFGIKQDGTRATTVAVRDHISQSGYAENGSQAQEITPDLFTQLINNFRQIVIEQNKADGNIGFKDWSFDENGYLHLWDDDGNDVIEPVYIDVGPDGLTEEQVQLAENLVGLAQGYSNTAIEKANIATTAANDAAIYKESARVSAEDALHSQQIAEQKATQSSQYAQTAATAKDIAVESKQTVQDIESRINTAVNDLQELAQLESIKELAENGEKAELFAKASKGYAQEAKEAQNTAASSKQAAEESAESAEASKNAAEQSATAAANSVTQVTQLTEGAIQAVEQAKETAISSVNSASETVLQETAKANLSAENAKVSETNAALSAEKAEQVAEKNGYMYFGIEEGHLIETRTDNVSEDINFTLENGRLIATYE